MLNKWEEQKKELADKFNVMKQIFGLRSQKIQTLALLQKYIPQSCWLTNIRVREGNMGGDGNAGPSGTWVEVTGYSSSIDDIQTYTSSLNLEKAVFDKVRAPNISAEEGGRSDVKKFTFEIKLKE